MSFPTLPPTHACIRIVASFQELLATPLGNGVNALCWPRRLAGDFAELVACLGAGEGIVPLDEPLLRNLPLGEGGRMAMREMLRDQELLREQGLDPEINCIHGYPRDEINPGPLATDVLSFHVDSATAEADTWLCTYHGAPSEGLFNEQAFRRVDLPEIRSQLLLRYGGQEDAGFLEFLEDHCHDLHYVPAPDARPYSFGVGNLWRVATAWPGSPVAPCIHRAPDPPPGQSPRLLLIA
jgi:hypothetical protein